MNTSVKINNELEVVEIEMPNGNTTLISSKALGSKLDYLQNFYHEVLGVAGWSDDLEESGVLPVTYCKDTINNLRKENKRLRRSLELRDAANGKCNKCGTLHAEPIIHCDVCGAFQ